MYYKEEFINGKWFWKSSPNGEWVEFSKQQYYDKLVELNSQKMQDEFDQLFNPKKDNTKADYFEKYQYEAKLNQELESKLFELQKQIKDNFVLSALKDKYSKEDMINFANYCSETFNGFINEADFNEWVKTKP